MSARYALSFIWLLPKSHNCDNILGLHSMDARASFKDERTRDRKLHD